MIPEQSHDILRREPRWPVIIAVLAAVSLHFVLPIPLRINPPWLLASVVIALISAAEIARYRGLSKANAKFGFSVLVILTVGLLWGVGRLIYWLLVAKAAAGSGTELIRGGAVLWVSNIIVFASAYWRLDAGGPNERERRETHTEGAFLFPQMTMSSQVGEGTIAEEGEWRPHFIDYLFIAFNTSTAFSPTDAPVLSKWAKVAMMVQSFISFTTVALIAARGVNII